jgi:4'-phosphopantetheinyl transferase
MLALGSDEVHVWRARLDAEPASLARWRDTLSSDEKARADRFHSPVHGDQCIAGRGILRDLLARYVRIPAGNLQLSSNSHGKPFLVSGNGVADVRFNVSHSRNLALFAFALRREVGVDIECLRPAGREVELAERFFSPREVEGLRALPLDVQREAFFRCWTRKEAYIKARGVGLSMSLSSFAVPLDSNLHTYLPIMGLEDAEARQWRLRQLEPGEGYVAAVAKEGTNWPLGLWQYQGGN